MRLLPNVSYGTERYPKKVARRLRVLNVAAWSASAFAMSFAIYHAFNQTHWKVVAVNALFSCFILMIPLWHRFGELAAPLMFIIGVYVEIFTICWIVGTDSGMQAQYLAVAAGIVLVVGPKRVVFFVTFSVLAAILIILLEAFAPQDGGVLNEKAMFEMFIACIVGTCLILLAVVFYAVREADRAEAVAEREHERSESLLMNILPVVVVGRLKSSSVTVIADKYEEVSILFADMAGFTALASETAPIDLVHFLNRVFTAFDHLVESHGLEKIKTTGDAYMALSGAPALRPDHAAAAARLALDMLDVAAGLRDPHGRSVPIRIGMASGPVVAGVVGARKFFYDVWGDAVNVAARMESTGAPGKIQVSQNAYARLKDEFVLEPRGVIDVKGKGPIPTWFLIARR